MNTSPHLPFLHPTFYLSDLSSILLPTSLASCDAYMPRVRYDENQLVSFVIRSKSLGFVTTGLLSGVYAFAKLYVCVTEPVKPLLR